MTRYDRSIKRKAGRKMDAEQRQKEKEREKKKADKNDNTIKPKWRKLSDGGVAFGDKFKIGKTGLMVLPAMLIVMVVTLVGIQGTFDEFLEANLGSNGVEQNFEILAFDECELIEFNSAICTMEYKFCREYADGESICEYAEEDPFVNVDPNETKYTEEEQDFAPPGFINIIPSAYGASLQQELEWQREAEKQRLCGGSCEEIVEVAPPPEFDGQTIHLTKSKFDSINPVSIGIERSRSCEASFTCMSNTELVTLYDNTHQVYSGKFLDDGNGDVYRGPSKYISHWNIYPYVGMPVVMAVEPDAKWKPYMTSNIVIEPSSFKYIDKGETSVVMGHGTGGNVTNYNNIYLEGCSFARVSSDPEIINQVVEYFLSKCETEAPNRDEIVMIPSLPVNHEDFQWYAYTKWLQVAAVECRDKC